jgi:ribosome modulation factor
MNDDEYAQDFYDNDSIENEDVDSYDAGYNAGVNGQDCEQEQNHDLEWVRGWEDGVDDEKDKERALRMRESSFNS